MRIVIVKGNRFEAESIRQIATCTYPKAKITVCGRGGEALAVFRAELPYLALVGLNLSDMDGLDLIQEASAERSVARILVLADRHDEHTARVLADSRVDGCFDSLTEGSEALSTAIRKVGEGRTYFSATWREFRRESGWGRILLSQILSAAELQVFAVIGDGKDDQEAAGALGLSAKTVHTHRQRIMRKLDVRTRSELMIAAIQRGVVRFTGTGVVRPGLERILAERRARGRAPFELNEWAESAGR